MERIIQSTFRILTNEQSADGHFAHTGWTEGTTALTGSKRHSVFFTSLILSALDGLTPLATFSDIQKRCAMFLLSQKSAHGTFNYWLKNSTEAGSLPDDWDDTACGLAALYLYDPTKFDGAYKAALTQNLIGCETVAGGPYRTWILQKPAPPWDDTDVAVNANISWLLSSLGIVLPPLQKYLEHSIQAGQFRSPYYPSPEPVLYFLSRGYRGALQTALVKTVQSLPPASHPLSAALRLLTVLNCGVGHAGAKAEASQLELLLHQPDWQPGAFCFDPTENNKPTLAGSASLDAVIILKALQGYRRNERGAEIVSTKTIADSERGMHEEVTEEVQKIINTFPTSLSRYYPPVLERLARGDPYHQITLLPFWTAAAIGIPLAQNYSAIIGLGSVSLWGWLAYTLFDDIVDGDVGIETLPAANRLLQELTTTFALHATSNDTALNFFRKTMDTMEAATTWELSHCRIHNLRIPENLPEFKNLEHLAEKSLGHTLAPIALALLCGKIEALAPLKNFFHHYLIARQLHDDAHDWLEDLRVGHLTYANCLVLKECGLIGKVIELEKISSQLTQHFWHSTIDTIVKEITHHLSIAELSLTSNAIASPEVLVRHLLLPLHNATKKARTQSIQAREFLATYRAPRTSDRNFGNTIRSNQSPKE